MQPGMKLFLVLDGNCKEAIDFYTQVFDIDSEKVQITTFGDMMDDQFPEVYNDKVVLAEIEIFGNRLYLVDYTSYEYRPYSYGTNYMLTLVFYDKDQLIRTFDALSQNGTVYQPPMQTNATELGAVTVDRFGVVWQLFIDSKWPN